MSTERSNGSGPRGRAPGAWRTALLVGAASALLALLTVAWHRRDAVVTAPVTCPSYAMQHRMAVSLAIARLTPADIEIEAGETRCLAGVANRELRWTASDGSESGTASVTWTRDRLAGCVLLDGAPDDGRPRGVLLHRDDDGLDVRLTHVPERADLVAVDEELVVHDDVEPVPVITAERTTLRMLFVATPRAVLQCGVDRAHLERGAALALATTQQALVDSAVPIDVVSAGVVLMPYDVGHRPVRDLWDQLGELDDPLAADVERARIAARAEVVCFVALRPSGRMHGYATLCDELPSLFPGRAAHIVIPVSELRHGDLTLAHEFGHVLGLPDRPAANDGEPAQDIMGSGGRRRPVYADLTGSYLVAR